jgi:RNA polymerase sigma factor (sigma-70 family)
MLAKARNFRMDPTDKQLLLACRRGDERAWEALVHRYQRLIYTIPQRAGLDQDQAAEVFQEVFITLLQKLDDIEQPERLHAWLVTTARRKTWRLISRDRSLQQTGTDDDDSPDLLADLPDNAALPDEVLEKLEEQHRVRSGLAELDERCRTLLTMLYYNVPTPGYSEIAAQLAIPEGSIGPTRARCLKKLTRILEL